jgi:hypothetical protein
MSTIAAIQKEQLDSRLECALVVHDGRLLEIAFARNWGATFATHIEVRDYFSDELLASHPWPGGMGCAVVDDNNVINIFGNTNWAGYGNKIIRSTLDPVTYEPSTPADAMLVNATFRFYNCDVTKYGDKWRAVVEVGEPSGPAIYFAESSDLATWVYKGGALAYGGYVGCPSIDWIPERNAFFLSYLKAVGGRHVTQAAKSVDNCFTFSYFSSKSPNPAGSYLLDAEPGTEGKNASDASFVEFEGKVYGVYLTGDQSTIARRQKFTFDGTLAELYDQFF